MRREFDPGSAECGRRQVKTDRLCSKQEAMRLRHPGRYHANGMQGEAAAEEGFMYRYLCPTCGAWGETENSKVCLCWDCAVRGSGAQKLVVVRMKKAAQ
jgi:hypothetical protein